MPDASTVTTNKLHPALSRAALLVVFPIAVVGVAFAFAPNLLLSELVILGLWIFGCFGWGSAAVRVVCGRVRIEDEPDRALRAITALALGMGMVGSIVLGMGLLGRMNRWWAIGLLAGGGVLSIQRFLKSWHLVKPWSKAPAGTAWGLTLLAPIVAASFIGAMMLPGLLFPDEPAGYDAVGYHLEVPREWFELHKIVPLWHNTFSLNPMLMEMHYLLAMHLRDGPWQGMYLAQLMHAATCAAVPFAVYGAVRPFGRGRAVVGALLCGTMPWLPMLGAVAYDEGLLLLLTTLALGWAIRATQAGPTARHQGAWVLAGLCIGFSCGVKYPAVVTVLALVPACVLLRALLGLFAGKRLNNQKGGLVGFTAMLIAAALVASPWYARNYLWTDGNPVFPLESKFLGKAHWDDGQVERFTIAHSARPDQRTLKVRVSAFAEQVLNDYRWGAPSTSTFNGAGAITGESPKLASMALLVLPASLLLGLSRRQTWILLFYLLGLGAYWLFLTHLQGRFFTQAIPVIAMLLVLPGWTPWLTLMLAVVGAQAWQLRLPIVRYESLRAAIGAPDPRGLYDEHDTPDDQKRYPPSFYHEIFETDRPVVLIGDSKAFLFSIPMSRLHYRYVFDVPSTGDDLVKVWGGDVPKDAIIVVDPNELKRLVKTYRRLPALDDATSHATGVFVK